MKNYVDIYSRILDDERLHRLGYDGKSYIDVFAGSGVNFIGDIRTPLGGSLPIAVKYSYPGRGFNHYHGIELNPEYANALNDRLRILTPPENFTVHVGESETLLPRIIHNVQQLNHHYLAFVDYEDLRGLSWDSLRLLLENDGDVWITYLHSQARTIGRSRFSEEDRRTLQRLLGFEISPQEDNLESCINRFIEQLRRYRPNVVRIVIDSGLSYKYSLIFATRQTTGGSGYVNAVTSLKNRIEHVNGIFVERAIEIIEGRQGVLY